MKQNLSILLFLSFSLPLFAGEVASIHFKALEADLRDWYLAQPKNIELRIRYEEAKSADKKRQEAIQQNISSSEGNKVDFKSLMPKSGEVTTVKLNSEMTESLKKELYLLLESMELEFDLVYDSSHPEAIVFAKSTVEDITPLVRQHLIRLSQDRPAE